MATLYDVFGTVNRKIRKDLEKLFIELKKKEQFDEFYIQGIVLELKDMVAVDNKSILSFLDYVTTFSSDNFCNYPISHKLKKVILERKDDILGEIVEDNKVITEPDTSKSQDSIETSNTIC